MPVIPAHAGIHWVNTMDIHRAHGPGMSGYRPPYRGTGNVSPVWQRANVGRFRREVRRRVCRRRRRCVQQHCGLRVDDPIRCHRRPCLAQVLPSSERLPRSRHRTRRPAHACRGRGAQLQTPRSRSRRGNAQAFDAKSGYAHAVTRLRSLGSSRDVATSEARACHEVQQQGQFREVRHLRWAPAWRVSARCAARPSAGRTTSCARWRASRSTRAPPTRASRRN